MNISRLKLNLSARSQKPNVNVARKGEKRFMKSLETSLRSVDFIR